MKKIIAFFHKGLINLSIILECEILFYLILNYVSYLFPNFFCNFPRILLSDYLKKITLFVIILIIIFSFRSKISKSNFNLYIILGLIFVFSIYEKKILEKQVPNIIKISTTLIFIIIEIIVLILSRKRIKLLLGVIYGLFGIEVVSLFVYLSTKFDNIGATIVMNILTFIVTICYCAVVAYYLRKDETARLKK